MPIASADGGGGEGKPANPEPSAADDQGAGDKTADPEPSAADGEAARDESVEVEPGLMTVQLRLKALGDFMESVVGAYVQHGGAQAGREALRMLNVLDKLKAEEAVKAPCKRTDEVPEFVASSLRLGRADEAARAQVSEACGYSFRSTALVREALTHCSRHFEKSYQRLEFLGDAVLDYIVTNALYHVDEFGSPGVITAARSVAVSNNSLAKRCVALGLHGRIRHLSSQLGLAIRRTVQGVEAEEQLAAAEQVSMTAHCLRKFHSVLLAPIPCRTWAWDKKLTSVLADCFLFRA